MFCKPGYDFAMLELEKFPGNYLEIGVFNGDSIAGIAAHYPEKMIYGVDPFVEDGCTSHTTHVGINQAMPVQRENTYNNIAPHKNIKLFEMFSRNFLKELSDDLIIKLNVDGVLIDGSHHYEDVVIDTEIALKLIGDRVGFIIFDDCNLPGVAQAYLEFLMKHNDKVSSAIDLFSLHPGHIMAHIINYK